MKSVSSFFKKLLTLTRRHRLNSSHQEQGGQNMRTIHELAELTGISVRTLHYYDQIGLFKPTAKSEAGYRLYDDKALEALQQILFFREFDIPLKEIRALMENPALDRNHILQMQRSMLVEKKARMERLIDSLDTILKGDNKMDFSVFTRTEMEQMFQNMAAAMPEELRQSSIREYGGLEAWKQFYMEKVSSLHHKYCHQTVSVPQYL